MRGLSLLVLVAAVLIVGYLNLRTVEQHVPANPDNEGTAERIENQVKDTLQQYQKKLDKQAENQ